MNATRLCLPRLVSFLLIAALPGIGRAEEGFALKDHPGAYLDVLHDGTLVARYMYAHDTSSKARLAETYKPYLHVFDPKGTAPITKGPGGLFPHHRGIFIGWRNIEVNGKKYDRWHMIGGDQIHEKFQDRTADKDSARFTSLVRWTGDKPDDTLLEEERTFTFRRPPAPGYLLIDADSRIKAVAGDALLGDPAKPDPEHTGLQFRPANELDRAQTKYLYPAAKANPHKDRDYPWVAATFTLKDKPYSVVYLNHPGNPRRGLTSAYRDYGRFGMCWETKIPKGQTREFRARFLIVAGEMPSAEVIQQAWNQYAGANQPVPSTTAKAAESSQPTNPKKTAPKKPVR